MMLIKIIKRPSVNILLTVAMSIGSVAWLSIRSGYGLGYVPVRAKEVIKSFLFRGYGPKTVSGRVLLSEYCRLCALSLFQKNSEPCQERMLVFTVFAFEPLNVICGFAEIFIKECYYFTATRNDPFIIDCGSNIGISVLYFKMLYPNSEILAFEPSKHCFEMLQRNIQNNAMHNVVAVNKAVCDRVGTCSFWDPSHGKGDGRASIVVNHNDTRNLTTTECAKLSSYISKPVDLLKMDVEGAEHEILNDLIQSKKLALVRQLVLEYHHHTPTAESDQLGHFLSLLEEHGFGYQIRGCNFGIGYQFEAREGQVLIIHAYKKQSK